MSRVLISALVVSVFGVGSAHAGSLNINPFPMEKAGTLSSQGPTVQSRDSVREFADKIGHSTIDGRQDRARRRNSVDMTPMPNEISGRGAYVPQVAKVTPHHQQRLDLNNARIEVLPYDASFDPERPAFLTATKGESVEDVLRSWSENEGVGVVWKTRMRFGVAETIAVEDGYEKSVEVLLSQFAGTSRPLVGQLDTDPVTGVRTLSVMTR